MSGLIRIEKLTEGEFAVGTRWREVRKMYGKEAVEEFEVKSCERPESFTIYVDGSKGSSKKGEYFFDHLLIEENGGTRFEIHALIDGMGWIGKIIGPIVGAAFKKAIAKDLHAMKEHIESGAA
ncbi:MAG: hypothetical protein ACI9H8_000017 [Lysobacterales bacterium]|jgi:hypothetical protein